MTAWAVRLSWSAVATAVLAASFGALGAKTSLAAVLVAATPAVAGLCLASLVVAAILGRPSLGVAVILVLSTLVAQPNFWRGLAFGQQRSEHHWSSDSEALTIVSSNVRSGNAQLPELVDHLIAQDPDVIVLLEIGDPELATLNEAGLVDHYPYVVADPRDGYFGSAIFSRWPLDGAVADVGGYPMIIAQVSWPEGQLDLVGAHVAPPLGSEGFDLWEAQLQTLEQRLAAARRPLVVVGDFNATPAHRELRELAVAGSSIGLGVGATYPVDGVLSFSFLALDHAFASGGACLVHIETLGEIPGSDHRALKLDVTVHLNPEHDCRQEMEETSLRD